MKVFLTSSLILASSVALGKRLERSIFIGKLGRRKMACIALSLATLDVMAVGGILLGGLALCLDAKDPFSLATGMKIKCEKFCTPLREWNMARKLQ